MNKTYLLLLGVIFIIINSVLFTNVSTDIKMIILGVMAVLTFGILSLGTTENFTSLSQMRQQAQGAPNQLQCPEDCKLYKSPQNTEKEILLYVGTSPNSEKNIVINGNMKVNPGFLEVYNLSGGVYEDGTILPDSEQSNLRNNESQFSLEVNTRSNGLTQSVNIKLNDMSVSIDGNSGNIGWNEEIVVKLKVTEYFCQGIKTNNDGRKTIIGCEDTRNTTCNVDCKTAEVVEDVIMNDEYIMSENLRCARAGNPYENSENVISKEELLVFVGPSTTSKKEIPLDEKYNVDTDFLEVYTISFENFENGTLISNTEINKLQRHNSNSFFLEVNETNESKTLSLNVPGNSGWNENIVLKIKVDSCPFNDGCFECRDVISGRNRCISEEETCFKTNPQTNFSYPWDSSCENPQSTLNIIDCKMKELGLDVYRQPISQLIPTTTSTTTNAPTTQAANVPPTQAANVPPTQAANLPTTQAANLPTTQAANVPPTQAANVPVTKAANVPVTKAANVPVTKAANVPTTQAPQASQQNGMTTMAIQNRLEDYNFKMRNDINANTRNLDNTVKVEFVIDGDIGEFLDNNDSITVKSRVEEYLRSRGVNISTQLYTIEIKSGSIIVEVTLSDDVPTDTFANDSVIFPEYNTMTVNVSKTQNILSSNEKEACPTTSANVNVIHSQLKEEITSMLQLFSLDELKLLNGIILLSDVNGKKDINKAISCLSKIDSNGLNLAKQLSNDQLCDMYLNSLTTYSETVPPETLFYSVSKIISILQKISQINANSYSGGRHVYEIMSIIENNIQVINSGLHQKSIHMGLDPQNVDLNNIFNRPVDSEFGTSVLQKLNQLLEKDKQHHKCDLPNSPYPAPPTPPKCLPQTPPNAPVAIIPGGNPGSVLNYTGVGSIMPKFAYTELYDPQYYN